MRESVIYQEILEEGRQEGELALLLITESPGWYYSTWLTDADSSFTVNSTGRVRWGVTRFLRIGRFGCLVANL